jgi:hypothetical protein
MMGEKSSEERNLLKKIEEMQLSIQTLNDSINENFAARDGIINIYGKYDVDGGIVFPRRIYKDIIDMCLKACVKELHELEDKFIKIRNCDMNLEDKFKRISFDSFYFKFQINIELSDELKILKKDFRNSSLSVWLRNDTTNITYIINEEFALEICDKIGLVFNETNANSIIKEQFYIYKIEESFYLKSRFKDICINSILIKDNFFDKILNIIQ